VYNDFGNREGITLVGCMAHARRKFYEAIDNDKMRAEQALDQIQELYAIERRAKEENLTHQQRCELRQAEAIPVLDRLQQWMKEQYAALPESHIGKAIAYSLRRWDKLCIYTTDGRLQIDNNLVENAIRPVAIGYA
jgi:transposase